MTPKPHKFRFETERLKTGPITYDVAEPPALFDLTDDPEYVFDEPVTGTLTLRLAGTTVLMSGFLRTVAKSPCARCLEPLRVSLRAEVQLTYMDDPRLLDAKTYPELVDDDAHWYDGEMVYPAEQLRELLLLELPPIAACELEKGDVCPIRNVKVVTPTFGEADAEAAKAVDETSFAGKLKKVRKDLKE